MPLVGRGQDDPVSRLADVMGVDVLVANILSGPLRELAPTFGSLVREGGWIVLAGLLEHQAADVTDAYTTWFDIHPFEVREGWSGLAGKRGRR